MEEGIVKTLERSLLKDTSRLVESVGDGLADATEERRETVHGEKDCESTKSCAHDGRVEKTWIGLKGHALSESESYQIREPSANSTDPVAMEKPATLMDLEMASSETVTDEKIIPKISGKRSDIGTECSTIDQNSSATSYLDVPLFSKGVESEELTLKNRSSNESNVTIEYAHSCKKGLSPTEEGNRRKPYVIPMLNSFTKNESENINNNYATSCDKDNESNNNNIDKDGALSSTTNELPENRSVSTGCEKLGGQTHPSGIIKPHDLPSASKGLGVTLPEEISKQVRICQPVNICMTKIVTSQREPRCKKTPISMEAHSTPQPAVSAVQPKLPVSHQEYTSATSPVTEQAEQVKICPVSDITYNGSQETSNNLLPGHSFSAIKCQKGTGQVCSSKKVFNNRKRITGGIINQELSASTAVNDQSSTTSDVNCDEQFISSMVTDNQLFGSAVIDNQPYVAQAVGNNPPSASSAVRNNQPSIAQTVGNSQLSAVINNPPSASSAVRINHRFAQAVRNNQPSISSGITDNHQSLMCAVIGNQSIAASTDLPDCTGSLSTLAANHPPLAINSSLSPIVPSSSPVDHPSFKKSVKKNRNSNSLTAGTNIKNSAKSVRKPSCKVSKLEFQESSSSVADVDGDENDDDDDIDFIPVGTLQMTTSKIPVSTNAFTHNAEMLSSLSRPQAYPVLTLDCPHEHVNTINDGKSCGKELRLEEVNKFMQEMFKKNPRNELYHQLKSWASVDGQGVSEKSEVEQQWKDDGDFVHRVEFRQRGLIQQFLQQVEQKSQQQKHLLTQQELQSSAQQGGSNLASTVKDVEKVDVKMLLHLFQDITAVSKAQNARLQTVAVAGKTESKQGESKQHQKHQTSSQLFFKNPSQIAYNFQKVNIDPITHTTQNSLSQMALEASARVLQGDNTDSEYQKTLDLSHKMSLTAFPTTAQNHPQISASNQQPQTATLLKSPKSPRQPANPEQYICPRLEGISKQFSLSSHLINTEQLANQEPHIRDITTSEVKQRQLNSSKPLLEPESLGSYGSISVKQATGEPALLRQSVKSPDPSSSPVTDINTNQHQPFTGQAISIHLPTDQEQFGQSLDAQAMPKLYKKPNFSAENNHQVGEAQQVAVNKNCSNLIVITKPSNTSHFQSCSQSIPNSQFESCIPEHSCSIELKDRSIHGGVPSDEKLKSLNSVHNMSSLAPILALPLSTDSNKSSEKNPWSSDKLLNSQDLNSSTQSLKSANVRDMYIHRPSKQVQQEKRQQSAEPTVDTPGKVIDPQHYDLDQLLEAGRHHDSSQHLVGEKHLESGQQQLRHEIVIQSSQHLAQGPSKDGGNLQGFPLTASRIHRVNTPGNIESFSCSYEREFQAKVQLTVKDNNLKDKFPSSDLLEQPEKLIQAVSAQMLQDSKSLEENVGDNIEKVCKDQNSYCSQAGMNENNSLPLPEIDSISNIKPFVDENATSEQQQRDQSDSQINSKEKLDNSLAKKTGEPPERKVDSFKSSHNIKKLKATQEQNNNLNTKSDMPKISSNINKPESCHSEEKESYNSPLFHNETPRREMRQRKPKKPFEQYDKPAKSRITLPSQNENTPGNDPSSKKLPISAVIAQTTYQSNKQSQRTSLTKLMKQPSLKQKFKKSDGVSDLDRDSENEDRDKKVNEVQDSTSATVDTPSRRLSRRLKQKELSLNEKSTNENMTGQTIRKSTRSGNREQIPDKSTEINTAKSAQTSKLPAISSANDTVISSTAKRLTTRARDSKAIDDKSASLNSKTDVKGIPSVSANNAKRSFEFTPQRNLKVSINRLTYLTKHAQSEKLDATSSLSKRMTTRQVSVILGRSRSLTRKTKRSWWSEFVDELPPWRKMMKTQRTSETNLELPGPTDEKSKEEPLNESLKDLSIDNTDAFLKSETIPEKQINGKNQRGTKRKKCSLEYSAAAPKEGDTKSQQAESVNNGQTTSGKDKLLDSDASNMDIGSCLENIGTTHKNEVSIDSNKNIEKNEPLAEEDEKIATSESKSETVQEKMEIQDSVCDTEIVLDLEKTKPHVGSDSKGEQSQQMTTALSDVMTKTMKSTKSPQLPLTSFESNSSTGGQNCSLSEPVDSRRKMVMFKLVPVLGEDISTFEASKCLLPISGFFIRDEGSDRILLPCDFRHDPAPGIISHTSTPGTECLPAALQPQAESSPSGALLSPSLSASTTSPSAWAVDDTTPHDAANRPSVMSGELLSVVNMSVKGSQLGAGLCSKDTSQTVSQYSPSVQSKVEASLWLSHPPPTPPPSAGEISRTIQKKTCLPAIPQVSPPQYTPSPTWNSTPTSLPPSSPLPSSSSSLSAWNLTSSTNLLPPQSYQSQQQQSWPLLQQKQTKQEPFWKPSLDQTPNPDAEFWTKDFVPNADQMHEAMNEDTAQYISAADQNSSLNPGGNSSLNPGGNLETGLPREPQEYFSSHEHPMRSDVPYDDDTLQESEFADGRAESLVQSFLRHLNSNPSGFSQEMAPLNLGPQDYAYLENRLRQTLSPSAEFSPAADYGDAAEPGLYYQEDNSCLVHRVNLDSDHRNLNASSYIHMTELESLPQAAPEVPRSFGGQDVDFHRNSQNEAVTASLKDYNNESKDLYSWENHGDADDMQDVKSDEKKKARERKSQYEIVMENDVRKFKCLACGKSFGVNTIYRHLRIHDPDYKVSCNLCGKEYTQRHSLTLHRQRFHPEEAALEAAEKGIKPNECLESKKMTSPREALDIQPELADAVFSSQTTPKIEDNQWPGMCVTSDQFVPGSGGPPEMLNQQITLKKEGKLCKTTGKKKPFSCRKRKTGASNAGEESSCAAKAGNRVDEVIVDDARKGGHHNNSTADVQANAIRMPYQSCDRVSHQAQIPGAGSKAGYEFNSSLKCQDVPPGVQFRLNSPQPVMSTMQNFHSDSVPTPRSALQKFHSYENLAGRSTLQLFETGSAPSDRSSVQHFQAGIVPVDGLMQQFEAEILNPQSITDGTENLEKSEPVMEDGPKVDSGGQTGNQPPKDKDSGKHICEICHIQLSSKNGYTIHMRRHTSIKTKVCTYCKKGFHTSQELRSHVRTHTGEKPYKCEICLMAFARSGSFITHKKGHEKRGENSPFPIVDGNIQFPVNFKKPRSCTENAGGTKRSRKRKKKQLSTSGSESGLPDAIQICQSSSVIQRISSDCNPAHGLNATNTEFDMSVQSLNQSSQSLKTSNIISGLGSPVWSDQNQNSDNSRITSTQGMRLHELDRREFVPSSDSFSQQQNAVSDYYSCPAGYNQSIHRQVFLSPQLEASSSSQDFYKQGNYSLSYSNTDANLNASQTGSEYSYGDPVRNAKNGSVNSYYSEVQAGLCSPSQLNPSYLSNAQQENMESGCPQSNYNESHTHLNSDLTSGEIVKTLLPRYDTNESSYQEMMPTEYSQQMGTSSDDCRRGVRDDEITGSFVARDISSVASSQCITSHGNQNINYYCPENNQVDYNPKIDQQQLSATQDQSVESHCDYQQASQTQYQSEQSPYGYHKAYTDRNSF